MPSHIQDRSGPKRPATGGQSADHHAWLHRSFAWLVPEHFNIADACCTRWARNAQTAQLTAIVEDPALGDAQIRRHTFAQLQTAANAWSDMLAELGVGRGDCVGIVLPQRFETAVAYMAVLQMGAIAMPLSQLFGPEALAYRLNDSQAKVAIGDENTLAALTEVRAQCPHLRSLVGVGPAAELADVDGSQALKSRQKTKARLVNTRSEDPAVLIYTSGTTGNPKGALIPHRALIGNLTGFVCSQNWFGFDPWNAQQASHAVFWSPADWAWTGGLMDALLPSLFFGRPIVACSARFSPDLALDLLQRHRITHTFLFPTALKAMMKAHPQPRQRFELQLEGLMSAGEAVGDAVFAYCQEQLGVTVNEMFGQTEINYVVGNCARLWPARAGSMGRAYPGHRVAVIDDAGQVCPVGTVGEVAVHRQDVHGHDDPVFFLAYWNNPKATSDKYSGAWCRTGDMAHQDADGYLWYQGRSDDMFKAAGYRIGPGEIENCLVKHSAVQNAAVVPKPDKERGAVVKAYVVLAPEAAATRAKAKNQVRHDQDLIASLQAHVRGQLAPYEYPKEIEFIAQLPMTTTGKVQRRILRLQEEARAAQAQ
jgi:acetyl-CoA synthetase